MYFNDELKNIKDNIDKLEVLEDTLINVKAVIQQIQFVDAKVQIPSEEKKLIKK